MRYQPTQRGMTNVFMTGEMRRAVERAAEAKAEVVRQGAPTRSGNLRRSVKVRGGNYEIIDGTTRVTAEIVADAAVLTGRWAGYAYAAAPEFGNVTQRAQHWMAAMAKKINDKAGRRT